MIDPRAIIDPTAILGADVSIGAWSVIGEQVVVGDGVVIATHVVVQAGTQIQRGCHIGPQSVIGKHLLAPTTLSGLSGLSENSEGQALTLGEDSVVCAQARVVDSVSSGQTVAGNPAQPT